MPFINSGLPARRVWFLQSKLIRATKYFNALLSLILLTACATPSERFAKVANDLGFFGFSLNSDSFDHQFYANTRIIEQSKESVLHVYLDGDGTPWEQHHWISDDPTSRNPMILKLMQEDNAASILLGRPCYHRVHKAPNCHNKYWTSHRYSREVVSSMASVLKLWLQNHSYKRIVLIGFSGGGTLAMLISTYLDSVDTVVTLASNLDVKAWSEFYGYGPLTNSLDPGAMSFNSRLRQIHMAGLKDQIVPANIIKSFTVRQKNAKYVAFADFDHYCCWLNEWKNILQLF